MAASPQVPSDEKVHDVKLFNEPLKQEISFLLCGRTGVGKTSLISSLIGMEVYPGTRSPDRPFQRSTTKVSKAVVNVGGVRVNIFESAPDLQDGTVDCDEEYLDDMYSKCKDVDIVIYCVDMTVPRYTHDEIRSTQLITNKFGVDFWNHCILVLTKANNVRVPSKERKSKLNYHQCLYKNHLARFREQLVGQDVPRNIADCIPAVAAGICAPVGDDEEDNGDDDERFIWYVSDKTEPPAAGTKMDFLKELWITCFERTKKVMTRDNFMRATLQQRFKLSEGDSQEKRRFHQLLQERDEQQQQIEELRNELRQDREKEKEPNISHQQTVNASQVDASLPPPPPPPPYAHQEEITLNENDMKRLSDTMQKVNEKTVTATVASVAGEITGATIGAIAGGPLGALAGAA